MVIKNIEFIGSFEKETQAPSTGYPEFAFIGRSNVGKSSLINMLTNRKSLARVSSTPGKTQHLNYFQISHGDAPNFTNWYIVDLPGYGYAKISKSARARWEKMIRHYMIKRKTLFCVFQLIDIRIPPQEIDIEFMKSLAQMHVPFVIIYTKSDKLKQTELAKNIAAFEKKVLEFWTELPLRFTSSAIKKRGKDDILQFVAEGLKTIDTINT